MTSPLQRLAELHAKATALPWTSNSEGGRDICDCPSGFYLESLATPFSRSLTEDDNAFVVAAVNAVPLLLALARAAEEVDRWGAQGLTSSGDEALAELRAALLPLTSTPTEATAGEG
jgi:hypothetical protein